MVTLVVNFGNIRTPAVNRATVSSLFYSGFMVVSMLLAAVSLALAPENQAVRTLVTIGFMIWPIFLGIHILYQIEPKRLAPGTLTPGDVAADDASSWYPMLACGISFLIYLPAMNLLGLPGFVFVLTNTLFAFVERRLIR